MSSDGVLIVAIVLLMLFAVFLSMAETALTGMNRFKAMALEEQGRRNADKLVRLVEHPERFLNPVLLLVLMCHLIIGTLVGILVGDFSSTIVAVATALEITIIFVFAEAAPKTWSVQHTERAALFVTPIITAIAGFPPIRLLTRGLIGLSNFILPGKGLKSPYVSEEELLAPADAAVEDDVIEREERALIHSIIEFGDTVVREVMVPRPDMTTVEGTAKIGDVMALAISAGYSRIPVSGKGIDDIIGLVYTKDLMRAQHEDKDDEEVRTLTRKPHFVPETKAVAELMREMQREKHHMAIVVDEYGGTSGLVTLEDLIEELIGEIVDEYDVEEAQAEPMSNGDYRVNARMSIDEVNELLGSEIPEGDWDTVGGFVFNQLGHVPFEGETVEFGGHRFRAEKVQGRRIGRIRVSRLPRTEAEEPVVSDDVGS